MLAFHPKPGSNKGAVVQGKLLLEVILKAPSRGKSKVLKEAILS
jgi:hypothetical protein